jgi:YVTN family beta-propeller protein
MSQQPDLNLLKLYRAHREEIEAIADEPALFALAYLNYRGGSSRAALQSDLGLDPAAYARVLDLLARAELISAEGNLLAITSRGKTVLKELGLAGAPPPPPPPRDEPKSVNPPRGGGFALGTLVGALVVVAALVGTMLFTEPGRDFLSLVFPQPATPTHIAQLATRTLTSVPTAVVTAATSMPTTSVPPPLTATSTATATQSPTPSSTSTLTRSPTATVTRTATPTRSATPTFTPSPTPTINPVVRVPVGNQPYAIAAERFGARVYVGDRSGVIYLLDPAARQVQAVAKTGEPISWLALSPKGEYLYATTTQGNVWWFETQSFRPLTHVNLDTGQVSEKPMIVSADGSQVVVADAADQSRVVAMYAARLGGIGRLGAYLLPMLPALTAKKDRLYVPSLNEQNVALYTPASDGGFAVVPTQTIKLPGKPTAALLNRDETSLYVTLVDQPLIGLIDTAKFAVAGFIRLPGSSFTGALSPDGTRLVVTSRFTNQVFVIDTRSNKLIQSFVVGSSPKGVAVSSDSRTAFTANMDDNSVSLVPLP